MRVLIINPNSDDRMRATIESSAKTFAGQDFFVSCLSTPGAPKFIETYGDELAAAPGMLTLVKENEEEFDAFVVACHCDPNLDAIKEITLKPVVGMGEASMKIASMLGHSFSVITNCPHSVPGKKALARKYNLENSIASVRAPKGEIGGIDETALYTDLARKAVEEDSAEVIVLGCAGLSGLDKAIEGALGVPVLDGVICALIIATGLIKYGVSTSKALGYNPEY